MLQQLVLLVGAGVDGREGLHVLCQMVHAVHAAQHGQDVGERAHPAEGPSGGAVVGVDGTQLVAELLGHASKCSATQRLHDDALNARLLAFVIEILCVGIHPSTLLQRGMAPVEEVHLYLAEIPVVLLLMVEQPVEVAHVTVVREAQMSDAACLALLQQEVEHAIFQEALLQRVAATADAMQQVVVDMVNAQLLHGRLVHLFGGLHAGVAPHVREFRGHEVFLAWVTAQGVAHQHFRLPSHVDGCRVEIVHAVLDGIVHQLVHLVLIVWQAHHAKAQQRNLLARAVLNPVGHAVLVLVVGGAGKPLQRLQRHQRHGRAGTKS